MSRYLYLILFIALLSSSCIKDKCGSVICENEGVCVNGVCACATGYEGPFCAAKWNEKFIGNWQVADSLYKDNIARYHYGIVITGVFPKDSFYVRGLTDTLSDSLLLCTRNAPRGFTIVANQKQDSLVTIVGGTGMMDSITGNIIGKYVFTRKVWIGTVSKDTTVTVGFSWKR